LPDHAIFFRRCPPAEKATERGDQARQSRSHNRTRYRYRD